MDRQAFVNNSLKDETNDCFTYVEKIQDDPYMLLTNVKIKCNTAKKGHINLYSRLKMTIQRTNKMFMEFVTYQIGSLH